MTRYSEDFKQMVINRILSPESPSIRSIAKEYEIPLATVFNWLQKIDINNIKNASKEESDHLKTDPSIELKFNAILETCSLNPEELSAYCRNKGIYSQDIEAWKQEMMHNLDSRNNKRLFAENRNLKIKLRELQAELRCKDKALAETSALLLLKKKARIIWEDQEDEKFQ